MILPYKWKPYLFPEIKQVDNSHVTLKWSGTYSSIYLHLNYFQKIFPLAYVPKHQKQTYV